MYPSNIDVPVLLIFFNRPGCFAQVFEQVKKARPSKLFLYQDGARAGNEKDKTSVAKCRAIAEDIDWECEGHRFYQAKNYGCDPSGYIAQKWAFENVDRCIVLEDDCVPSQSFFPFCKELLERFANDERVNMICGMNNLEQISSPYSYLFTETGSIWGWATWKRVADTWEENTDVLDDIYSVSKLERYLDAMGLDSKRMLTTWKSEKESGVVHHETVKGTNQFSNHRLNIVPTQNMIINVGNTPEGGTHSMSSLDLIPRGLRRIYTMKSFEIEFPLRHPKYMINDVEFQKKLFRVMGWGHPFVQIFRKAEKAFLVIQNEGIGTLLKKIKTISRR